MSSSDTEYYRQRAIDERALAVKEERRNVAAIHEELARQYQALVDKAELRPELQIRLPERRYAATHVPTSDLEPVDAHRS
jgi:hypothetical protein